jgi:pyruvate/2-oxoglutarate dehydrogenase complex dihydrolipoamide acyltransferase (E2) component
MPFTYNVPVPSDLSASARIVLKEWLLNPGDYVNKGYGLALLETDRGLFELCASGKGLVHRHNAKPGTEVPDRASVCVIAAEGEDIPYGREYSTSRRAEERQA